MFCHYGDVEVNTIHAQQNQCRMVKMESFGREREDTKAKLGFMVEILVDWERTRFDIGIKDKMIQASYHGESLTNSGKLLATIFQ